MKIRNAIAIAVSSLFCAAGIGAQGQTRILPLGDSVTSSFAPRSSYRYWLWNRLVQNGYNVDFVGTQWGVGNGTPEKSDFDQHHEGHAGWTTTDALPQIKSIAQATQPDIVLLDLGSNDLLQDRSIAEIQQNLALIIQEFRAVNPNVIIVLAQPPPFQGPNRKMMSRLKGAVSKVAKQNNRSDSRIYVANLFGGYNVNKDTFDGAHPNETGELKIANRYFKVLKKILR